MKWLHYELVCTIEKLVLVPSMDLEQPKAMQWSAARFSFFHFGKNQNICEVLSFKLTLNHTIMIFNVSLDHWDQKERV